MKGVEMATVVMKKPDARHVTTAATFWNDWPETAPTFLDGRAYAIITGGSVPGGGGGNRTTPAVSGYGWKLPGNRSGACDCGLGNPPRPPVGGPVADRTREAIQSSA